MCDWVLNTESLKESFLISIKILLVTLKRFCTKRFCLTKNDIIYPVREKRVDPRSVKKIVKGRLLKLNEN